MNSPVMSVSRYGSSLSRQIQHEKEQESLRAREEASSSSSKTPSLSDISTPSLSPSPAIIETGRTSKDDTALSSPTTPRRPNPPVRGLSLQMPQRDARGPLSPKLDQTPSFGSPVLPRRSRGLDFSRACTNLHHSTLAESSPDSSPTISGVRGMHIPRKSLGNTGDLGNGSNGLWSTTSTGDRTALSSSVSSVNMLDSELNSSDSSDDDLMDRDTEDAILTTPQVMKIGNHFGAGISNSPGGEWMNSQYSPAAASLLSFQRARLGTRRSRNSSSSGNSSKPSPAPLSPPILKSVESQGYFGSALSSRNMQSRRESLSLGTNDLHLDDSADEDQGKMSGGSNGGTRGVIKRTVTRRGNLLPKTKTFARIRAELLEEAAPIDSETRREAQVIHQVRESEPISARPSPKLVPSSGPVETLESVLEDEAAMQESNLLLSDFARKKTNSFSEHAERNSAGLKFWNTFDERYRTPPPQALRTRSSSGMSMADDVSMGGGTSQSEGSIFKQYEDGRSRSSTPMANNAVPTPAEVTRKVNNKRRRDDDFDPDSFKRRAVSPGLSVQSSPILSQSPVFDAKTWGRPPKSNGHNDRSNSNASQTGGIKRIGLQGMTETNDGLMNMSIE